MPRKFASVPQFELIDVRAEEDVCKSWSKFIHTHHYDYCTDYFQSSLARFPRRTSEDYFASYYFTTEEEAFHDANPIPDGGFDSFDDMWAWHKKLIEIEEQLNANSK